MIKFFNKIRKGLLAENKFSKYLLYAIGEIILVVIGILIALQINNWNESRKALNEELALYQTMLNNVNDELLNTDWHLNNLKSYQNVHYHVYHETQGNAQYDSSIFYNTLQWIHPFNPIIHKNYSVSLVDVTKKEIRELLNANIYDENEAIDAYEEWNTFKEDQLRPFFSKHGIHNTAGAFNDQPNSFYSLLAVDLIDHAALSEQYGSVELDELLFDLRFKTSWLITNLNTLKESNRALAHAIEQELERNNISIEPHRARYLALLSKADELYESQEYQLSANKYKEAFDQNEGKTSDYHRYNAACSNALAEDIETAFYHLFRLANDSDYRNYEHLTTDTDLDNLHNDSRWNELIAIVQSNENESENEE